MPLTAAAPFAISRARPLERRRLLVLGVSLSLHATMLFAIGLLAHPVLRDSPSPAFEMMFGTPLAPLASAAPPALAVPPPAPLSAEAGPLPTAATAPPTPDPASAPAPETAPPPLPESPKTASHPAPARLASRRPATPAPRATTPSAQSPASEPASMPNPPPLVAAPVRAPAPVIVSSQWTGTLASWIRSRTRYPEAARQLRRQGVVAVGFTVGRDGQVLEAHVAQPSGSDMLDQAALEMFRGARVPAFPSDMQAAQVTISVPVRYRLEQ